MENVDLIRNFQDLKTQKFDEEKYKTATSIDQLETERRVEKLFDRFAQARYLNPDKVIPELKREHHFVYLQQSVKFLSSSYECLDSSRPWMVYWILNAASLLGESFSDEEKEYMVNFLIKCRGPTGGFGGGPGQYAHLAPTYAAVNALVIIGTPAAYNAIDKASLLNFLRLVREEETGAFRMHVDGEIDVRGAYCTVAVAKLVNIDPDEAAELFRGTAEWVVECQTYEGGMGGVPNQEAHGGYTFCGIATLALLDSPGKCDLEAVLRWTINKQMKFEGGFQGRTNKLVDGCYSFWCGAVIPIVQKLIAKKESQLANILKTPLFNGSALQEYILICCQRPGSGGGLLDKPDKPPDLYHTCYTLSGLSIAQHLEPNEIVQVIGDDENELKVTHPIFNVPPAASHGALMFFSAPSADTIDRSSRSQSTANTEGSCTDFDTLEDVDMAQ